MAAFLPSTISLNKGGGDVQGRAVLGSCSPSQFKMIKMIA